MSKQVENVLATLEDLATDEQRRAVADVSCAVPRILLSHYGVEAESVYNPYAVGEEVEVLERLTEEGCELADARYGTGWPNYELPRSGIKNLGHNNGRHARDFAADSETLNRAIDGNQTERAIDKVVAAWHDVDQSSIVVGGPRLGQDEKASAEQLVRRMREEKVAPAIAAVAAYGIMGTWPVVDKQGKVVGQWGKLAPEDYYPSRDARRAARHAAANDLGRLYAANGPFGALMLYAQRQGITPHEEPSLEGLPLFLRGQISFLDGHKYPVDEANKLFTPLKPQVVAFNEEALRRVENGVIDWRRLCLDALIFARQFGAAVPDDLMMRYAAVVQ